MNQEIMDQAFKFKIGDIVALKAEFFLAERDKRGTKILADKIIAYTILNRVLEECHGGVQVHYHARATKFAYDGAGSATDLVRFSELEVIPFPSVTERT